ncbi:MAG: flavodoxin family protein [Anaerolineae bacterium]|nr:flavodoxin family protein [Anaerolineae bacterium]
MKALVIYDSVFGNTEQIARAIGDALVSMGSVEVLPVSQVMADNMRGLDVLIVGSPTRSLRPTEGINRFLSRLAKGQIQGVRVAAFDTRWALETIDGGFLRFVVGKGGYAANAIGRMLKRKGGSLTMAPEGFLVTGGEGPLKDGELERAADWARHLLEVN